MFASEARVRRAMLRTVLRGRNVKVLRFALVGLLLSGLIGYAPQSSAEDTDLEVALGLAKMLLAARTVITVNQPVINDPDIGDKGLTGDAVITEAIHTFKAVTGTDPREVDPDSLYGRLLRAQMQAIREVIDDNQDLINRKGVGFKGFVPAVFARLTNERFGDMMGEEADMKSTAPPPLVRNRKARPDSWEAEAIKRHLMSKGWPKGKVYAANAQKNGRDAFRVLVPDYYGPGCLACHGEPKGEIDVTGYPKEGAKLGDLGGVISVTLYH